jgi:hypothetical protein
VLPIAAPFSLPTAGAAQLAEASGEPGLDPVAGRLEDATPASGDEEKVGNGEGGVGGQVAISREAPAPLPSTS